jgi:hypothetical protein
MRADAADRVEPATNKYLIAALAWAIPGAGHLLLGRRQKGIIFLIALTLMFATGLWLEGRIFPLGGIGLPYFVAKFTGYGAGRVVAITYEYGNAFAIVAGLLNLLAVLDAWDVAEGRK